MPRKEAAADRSRKKTVEGKDGERKGCEKSASHERSGRGHNRVSGVGGGGWRKVGAKVLVLRSSLDWLCGR
jgi:hypothetical protein